MKSLQCLGWSAVFALGTLFGMSVDAGKNQKVDTSMYRNHEPAAAAENLLNMALKQAEKGTWERIAVGQIHYLSGDKDRAEEIFASIKKKDSGDWMRIGRIYYRAGDWEKAQEVFERVLDESPKDEDWLAEIGAYYNLKGDRATAESYFDRAFRLDPDNLYNTLSAAGSYVGVEER